MVGGGPPLVPEIFGPNWPRSSKNADFQSIFVRSISAITPSEKCSVIVNRKSTARFPTSLGWSAYVVSKSSPKREAQKRKMTVFRVKLHFNWTKSTTKYVSVNTVTDKVHWPICPCKMVGGAGPWGRPLQPFYVKIWPKLTSPLRKSDFQSVFLLARLVSQP